MTSDSTIDLKKRKEELKKDQERLIQLLKKNHRELYDWFISNNIDLINLKKFSVTIGALALLAFHTTYDTKDVSIEPLIYAPVNVIERQELQGLNEDEKAKLVWDRYGHVIKRGAKQYDLDPKLVYATVMVESMGDTYAIRHEPSIGDASYGLGQLLYGSAVNLGFQGKPEQLYDPEVNIDLICRYHKRTQEIHDEELTPQQLITAYNTGGPYSYPLPGHIAKFNKWFNKNSYLGV